jgi:hypothetical protein
MLMNTHADIPGLFVFPSYFSAEQSAELVQETLKLHAQLEQALSGTARTEKAFIPQPEFVRSAQHNLTSEELYAPLVLEQPGGRPLHCEYFPRYGEEGHSLGYFRGNANLPGFLSRQFLDQVQRNMVELGLAQPGQPLAWRLTMNVYRNIGGTVAGFPFHVDIPANGVVTMILNVQREVRFQIARGDLLRELSLPVGALLVLSGESRYQWKHRVLPMASHHTDAAGQVERVSLVLGFR